MTQAPASAILAPVPLVHLLDGAEVCDREGKVAFGSQAWSFFAHLDDHDGRGDPVLIYASHGDGARPVVTWIATYLRYVHSKGGAHPDRDRYRPRSCLQEDREGFWAGFYEVANLRPLDAREVVPIGALGDANGRPYRKAFIPEGPTSVSVIAPLPTIPKER
ncbi:MAG: hypothetical protein ACR2MB_16890 [Acidimicrobiales bacterium]